ncbi:MAG: electron transfer flavoprotein subunit beta/FixA family protein [Muribaculaceae bacterium]|jgi:electron transfer flavoprotein beta subunit|nr:electron transfer flavoprotein subunit beta/FixA family protein [Muribaculaceae bacterium]MBQ1797912.1 electron transfer flavoprotein subunit beta/FixA family protein [Muribaculaceae bacterium]MBQ2235262.1 electron transfer flavoprotein subunit beta/FixA family protein [Muribaculaceae bacterium]
MSLKIVVLAKQVPDTRNVGKDAMKADGTINRAALPAIFNPEDLNALEQALQLKDAHPGSTITLVTMGLPRSAEMVRECLYRGGDGGVVLTDRPLGGADTLATSYSLAQTIRHLEGYDIILGGRQAIDGDTAQVGPQIAEKLGLPQVTYAEQVTVADGVATIKRRIERGFETVQCPLPLVVTVNGSADACRPRNARLVQKFKYAVTPSEKAQLDAERQALVDARPYLNIREWGVADIEADPEQIGLKGSPTKVKTVVNVVFQAKESKRLDGSNEGQLEELVQELIADHIIG